MSKVKRLDPTRIGEKAEALKAYLLSTVIGQDEAIEQVTSGLSNYFAGLNDPNRPLVNMLFLGSTGIGKTYLCEKLAEHLCGDSKALTRIACESFQHSHEVAKLLGSPAGYVGHNDTAAFLSQRELNKWKNLEWSESGKAHTSVLLFDEIDKAHPALWKVLLGILDSGRLTLSNGQVTDFSKTVIVMTANFGAVKIAKMLEGGMGFAPQAEGDISLIATKEAQQAFSPEFFNRLDAVVTFKNLTPESVAEICECELGKVQRRCRECEIPFLFSVTADAKDALAKEGFSKKWGARELKRVIEKRIVHSLANLLSSNQIKTGAIIRIDFSESDGFTFTLRSSLLPFSMLP